MGSNGCRLIRARERYEGKQSVSYEGGISAQSVGAVGLSMHLVTLPPGARSRAHKHEHHETAIYVLSGRIHVWSGTDLRDHVVIEEGDFFYIPADEPHIALNANGDAPARVVLARTDPNDQESVVVLSELEQLSHLH